MIPSTLKCTCKIVTELDQHTNQLKEVHMEADRSGMASSVRGLGDEQAIK